MLFLAMVPLGSMATEVRTGGHMASNVQGTALEEAQDVSALLLACWTQKMVVLQ